MRTVSAMQDNVHYYSIKGGLALASDDLQHVIAAPARHGIAAPPPVSDRSPYSQAQLVKLDFPAPLGQRLPDITVYHIV
jgi:hypothetical protein